MKRAFVPQPTRILEQLFLKSPLARHQREIFARPRCCSMFWRWLITILIRSYCGARSLSFTADVDYHLVPTSGMHHGTSTIEKAWQSQKDLALVDHSECCSISWLPRGCAKACDIWPTTSPSGAEKAATGSFEYLAPRPGHQRLSSAPTPAEQGLSKLDFVLLQITSSCTNEQHKARFGSQVPFSLALLTNLACVEYVLPSFVCFSQANS